jgi:hypothetical protein
MKETKNITFNINNLDYTVNIGFDRDGGLEKELFKLLSKDGTPIDTKLLLSAYMHQTVVLLQYKQKIDEMINKIDE